MSWADGAAHTRRLGDNENPFIVIVLKMKMCPITCVVFSNDNKLFYCPGRKKYIFLRSRQFFSPLSARWSGFSCFMINGLIIIVVLVVAIKRSLALTLSHNYSLMKKPREKWCVIRFLFDLVHFFLYRVIRELRKIVYEDEYCSRRAPWVTTNCETYFVGN